MNKVIVLSASLFLLLACTESERPAAQAKHALDSAQSAADDAARHAQEMADQAQEIIDK